MDVLWIGDISLADAHEWSSDKIDDFPMDGDLLTKEFESGAQHHLRDFSHYLTPVGLMFSLLMQFTGKGYETKTNGEFVSYDVLDGNRKVSRILFI